MTTQPRKLGEERLVLAVLQPLAIIAHPIAHPLIGQRCEAKLNAWRLAPVLERVTEVIRPDFLDPRRITDQSIRPAIGQDDLGFGLEEVISKSAQDR